VKITLLSLVLLSTAWAQADPKPSPMRRSSPTPQAESFPQTPQPQTMQEAIAFERHKEAAAARQARIEARRQSSKPDNSADREQPSTVKDEKAPGGKPGK